MKDATKVAVVGMGLIGGSFEKASLRAGYLVQSLHHGDNSGFEDADIILVCLPPRAVVPWIVAHSPSFKKGAFVVDIAGVKRTILNEIASAFPSGIKDWIFVGGHPMAGKEVSGYANSSADLFQGASMILVPEKHEIITPSLRSFFISLGFSRVVITTAERHDQMISFTSQLCHLISSAYVRDDLALFHEGFSAGSFRDMARVGAPDPEMWTELFLENADMLLPVLERYIARLEDFRSSLATLDRQSMKNALAKGAAAKALFGKEIE